MGLFTTYGQEVHRNDLFTECPTEMPIVFNCREEIVWSYCNISVFIAQSKNTQKVNWYNQIKRTPHL